MNTNTIIDSTAETLMPAIQAQKNVLEAQIHLHCENFRRIEHAALTEAVLCGDKLTTLKPLIPHGQFEEYVNTVFGINRNRASQWMRLANEYPAATLQTELTRNLPSYTAALELLDSRNDTPDMKAVKTQIKEQIMVDGETYSVSQIKALKQQAIENEAKRLALETDFDYQLDQALKENRKHNEALIETRVLDALTLQTIRKDAEISQAQHYADSLQAELSAKDDDIESLWQDIAELRQRTGADVQAQISAMEANLEELKKQNQAKKKELANLDAAIFQKQETKAEQQELNQGLTELATKLERAINFYPRDMLSLRTRYHHLKPDKNTSVMLHMVAEKMQQTIFELYDIIQYDTSFAQHNFDRYLESYQKKQQSLLEN